MSNIEDTDSIYIPLCLPFMTGLYRYIIGLQLYFEFLCNRSYIILIRY